MAYPGEKPPMAQPYRGQPYMGQPSMSQPYRGQPYMGQPPMEQPYRAQPYRAQLPTAQPYRAQPPMAQPYMGQPDKGQTSAPPPYNVQQGQPEPGQAHPQMYGYRSYGGGYRARPYPAGQQYPAQPGVFTVQPAASVTQTPLAKPVNDYMGYSIFTLICCCLPLGIVALIHSISARDARRSGNQAKAEQKSKMAKKLNHIALGVGITLLVLSIISVVVVYTQVLALYN